MLLLLILYAAGLCSTDAQLLDAIRLIQEAKSYSWAAATDLDTANISESWMNFAMPSYAGIYFGSIVPEGERRIFKGKFPQLAEGTFMASLTAYDPQTGLPIVAQGHDLYYNNEMSAEVQAELERGVTIPPLSMEPFDQPAIVLLRYYIDRREVSFGELFAGLFQVRVEGESEPLPLPTLPKMHDISDAFEVVMVPWASRTIQPNLVNGSQFFKAGSLDALYPDPTNYYAVVAPLPHQTVLRITGVLSEAAMADMGVTYMDIMAVNHANTQTDDALPHYLWRGDIDKVEAASGGAWEIFVATHDAVVETESHVLRWQPGTTDRNIVFRLCDVSCFRGECKGMSALPAGYAESEALAIALGSLNVTVWGSNGTKLPSSSPLL